MKVLWNGITIQSNSDAEKLTYQIKVLIPKEKLDKATKITGAQKKMFDFNFSLKKAIDSDLVIVFDGSYKSNNSEIITSRCVSFERCTEYYHLKIRVWPKLYVSSKIKKKKKRLKLENDRYSVIIPSSPRKSTSSKYINYKGNNAQHPFSGGSITPK